jgi:hypothetical protein
MPRKSPVTFKVELTMKPISEIEAIVIGMLEAEGIEIVDVTLPEGAVVEDGDEA